MIDELLSGSWDQPTKSIVMHETQPTRLQDLASQFAAKAGVLVDLNERALQVRSQAWILKIILHTGHTKQLSSFSLALLRAFGILGP